MTLDKRPPGVMLYFSEMRALLALMSDEERGQILMAILDYAEYGDEPYFDERLDAAWSLVQKMLDRDAVSYREKCEKASKAVKARWEKEKKAGKKR